MTISLSSIDREQFVVRDCDVGGDDCALVFPSHLCVDWTPDNLHLRSVIFRKRDGLIVSAGLRKFFNLGEKPHLYASPDAHRDWRITTKLDGSLICVSCHNGQSIIRTRQTSDISVHETADEVRSLIVRHDVLRHPLLECGHSFIFEHCTPSLPIVIRYDQPSLTLLKIVQHEGYVYLPPGVTDHVARELGVARPEVHSFASLSDIVETCKTLRGMEGYVVEYNGGRDMVKCKGDDYLLRHRMRSAMASLGHVMDYWFSLTPRPTVLEEFFAKVESSFDHEVAKIATPHMCRVLYAADQVKRGLDMTRYLVEPLKSLPRRDAALDIQSRHVKAYQPAAFMFLSGREPDDKTVRRLMEATL